MNKNLINKYIDKLASITVSLFLLSRVKKHYKIKVYRGGEWRDSTKDL